MSAVFGGSRRGEGTFGGRWLQRVLSGNVSISPGPPCRPTGPAAHREPRGDGTGSGGFPTEV